MKSTRKFFRSTSALSHLKAISTASLAVIAVWALPLQAHEYYTDSFKVIHPWALPTAVGATSAPVYVRFEEISRGDTLVSADTELAEKVELHDAQKESGKPAAVALTAIDLPAGTVVDLQPDGRYLLLVGLKQPLQWQRSYPMTLRFSKSGPVQVMVSIGSH